MGMLTTKVLKPKEAVAKMNGVGFDSAKWNGSSLSLKLTDGTVIEITNDVNNVREGEVEKPVPSLIFSHILLPKASSNY